MLKETLERAVEKGVRIIVFSFLEFKVECKGVEIYSHQRPRTANNTNTRLMVVADDNMVIMADANNARGNWTGTVSNNALMKKVVREHIHNDIYMLKLRNIYGKEMYGQIYINTLQEKNMF